MGADAQTISSIQITIGGRAVSATNWPLIDGKMFITGSRDPVLRPDAVSAISGVVQGPFQMSGGFVMIGANLSTLVGEWTAIAPGAPPATVATPAPTAAPAATPPASSATTPTGAATISGSIPRAGGIGLVVFSGGTSTQLVTASGCPTATAAFWTGDGAGSFVGYVPGAAVAIVNADWNARFAAGLPANTPILGRCA